MITKKDKVVGQVLWCDVNQWKNYRDFSWVSTNVTTLIGENPLSH